MPPVCRRGRFGRGVCGGPAQNERELPTELGIVAGLVGSNVVSLMLLLVALIPLLDRALGTDRTLAAHRWLGKPALHGLGDQCEAFVECVPTRGSSSVHRKQKARLAVLLNSGTRR